MAPREVFVYIKGQIKLKDIIKVPANELWNRKLPKNFPIIKKPAKQAKPSNIQKEIDFFNMLESSLWVLFEFCSETTGNNIEERAFVTAVGNKISGSAIPVKTPNKLKASVVLYPANKRFCGI